jgi:predicted metal-dependent peptidase
MSDRELQLIAGELNSCAARTDFVVYPFDTRVRDDQAIHWRKGQVLTSFPRVACGGTDFQCCVDFIHSKQMKNQFDGYLIMTDGGACSPTKSRLRRGYILTPGNELLFEAEPSDIVIKMKEG